MASNAEKNYIIPTNANYMQVYIFSSILANLNPSLITKESYCLTENISLHDVQWCFFNFFGKFAVFGSSWEYRVKKNYDTIFWYHQYLSLNSIFVKLCAISQSKRKIVFINTEE